MAQRVFETVAKRKPRYSAFDLSYEHKLSCNMGELIPIYLQEILPGDHFKVNSEVMARMAPTISPIMHRVNVYVHYFFVPNRIIWDEWEDFITGGRLGTTTPTMPTIGWSGNGAATLEGALGDYFGLPTTSAAGTATVNVTELPFRAYTQIFNDYYRDQNVTDEVDITVKANIRDVRQRAWEKDYFTSCLPFAQRGNASSIPVSFDYASISTVVESDGSGATPPLNINLGNLTANSVDARLENLDATAVDFNVNDLRTASALQRWLETQATHGARYTETIAAHFDVKSSDARLQRAEYLGGGRQPMVISEVVNTSDTASAPQGNMAGHGISLASTNSFKKYFEEHGYVLGIMSILPSTAYSQGIERMWTRDTKEDYYWPEFANLGEQAVLNQEVYYDKDDATYNAGTFGYQQRWAEYKYNSSKVSGEFRSSLDFWHLGREFGSQPALNESFITAEYGVDGSIRNDIFPTSLQSVDNIYVQVFNSVKARRPMPYHANPSLA